MGRVLSTAIVLGLLAATAAAFALTAAPALANDGWVVRICRGFTEASAIKIEAGPKGAVVSFRDNSFANPDRLVAFIREQGAAARVRPDMKVVFFDGWEEPEQRLKGAAAKDVLSSFQMMLGADLEVAPGIAGEITLRLQAVPMRAAPSALRSTTGRWTSLSSVQVMDRVSMRG